jgi:hypothetical protein
MCWQVGLRVLEAQQLNWIRLTISTKLSLSDNGGATPNGAAKLKEEKMKLRILTVIMVFAVLSLFTDSIFAANGDLIVNGNLGVGTAAPAAKAEIGGNLTVDGDLITKGSTSLGGNTTVNGNLFTNGSATVSGQLSVGTQGVKFADGTTQTTANKPNYDSGWVPAPALNSNTIFTHNFGQRAQDVRIWVAQNSDGSGWSFIANGLIYDGGGSYTVTGIGIAQNNLNSINIRVAEQLGFSHDGTTDHTWRSSGYIRVMVWK